MKTQSNNFFDSFLLIAEIGVPQIPLSPSVLNLLLSKVSFYFWLLLSSIVYWWSKAHKPLHFLWKGLKPLRLDFSSQIHFVGKIWASNWSSFGRYRHFVDLLRLRFLKGLNFFPHILTILFQFYSSLSWFKSFLFYISRLNVIEFCEQIQKRLFKICGFNFYAPCVSFFFLIIILTVQNYIPRVGWKLNLQSLSPVLSKL